MLFFIFPKSLNFMFCPYLSNYCYGCKDHGNRGWNIRWWRLFGWYKCSSINGSKCRRLQPPCNFKFELPAICGSRALSGTFGMFYKIKSNFSKIFFIFIMKDSLRLLCCNETWIFIFNVHEFYDGKCQMFSGEVSLRIHIEWNFLDFMHVFNSINSYIWAIIREEDVSWRWT